MSKKRSTAEWRQICEEWKGSGLSQKDFAAQRGLNLQSFRWWMWNLGGSGTSGGTTRMKPLSASSSTDALQFLPVRVEEHPKKSTLRIRLDHLPLTVEVDAGFSTALLLDVLGALC